MFKNKILQLFADNRSNENKRSYKAEVEGNEATVYLYDAIGGWWGIEAKDFVKELNDLDVDVVNIRINSPGGDVFDARAIATAIKQLKAKTVAHIDSLAASAATYLALSCDEVVMYEGTFLMIHKAWTFQIGNADDMREVAGLLDKLDASIANDYAKKSGTDSDVWLDTMKVDTWYNENEALDAGLIDRIEDGDEEIDNQATWNLSAYGNVPQAYIDRPKNNTETVDPNKNLCYDREQFERRLALFEATGS